MDALQGDVLRAAYTVSSWTSWASCQARRIFVRAFWGCFSAFVRWTATLAQALRAARTAAPRALEAPLLELRVREGVPAAAQAAPVAESVIALAVTTEYST